MSTLQQKKQRLLEGLKKGERSGLIVNFEREEFLKALHRKYAVSRLGRGELSATDDADDTESSRRWAFFAFSASSAAVLR